MRRPGAVMGRRAGGVRLGPPGLLLGRTGPPRKPTGDAAGASRPVPSPVTRGGCVETGDSDGTSGSQLIRK